MKICGIIAEYNPFHNGHEYHISEARRVTGCDFVVVCMSGNFVQRGIPSIVDKYSRTRAALLGGADLVVELPVLYSTSSAESFAYGAVSILDGLGCDYLCFGSESENEEQLFKTANFYEYLEENQLEDIKALQKKGLSYAKAIEQLASMAMQEEGIMHSPRSNERLGIAYIRAINKINSKMKPVIVKRSGGNYLDNDISSGSAMAIRKILASSENILSIRDVMPGYSADMLVGVDGKYMSKPIFLNDFSDLMYMKLHTIINRAKNNGDARNILSEYLDVSDNIAGKIVANINKYKSYSEFAEIIHGAEYTKSRIYRALLHILLDIKKEDMKKCSELRIGYARILGFRKLSKEVLSYIKSNSSMKLVSKMADACNILSDEEYEILERDINASELYEYVHSKKSECDRIFEFERQIIICI